MLEWQSSRLAPFATQFAAVVIIVRQWGRQCRACRNPRSVSKPSRGGKSVPLQVCQAAGRAGGDSLAINS